jgi:hypothetical protein
MAFRRLGDEVDDATSNDDMTRLLTDFQTQVKKEDHGGRLPPTVFFAVMTVQEGAAPEVRASGEGRDAVVTVGRRTIRFDGTKIVLGVVTE